MKKAKGLCASCKTKDCKFRVFSENVYVLSCRRYTKKANMQNIKKTQI